MEPWRAKFSFLEPCIFSQESWSPKPYWYPKIIGKRESLGTQRTFTLICEGFQKCQPLRACNLMTILAMTIANEVTRKDSRQVHMARLRIERENLEKLVLSSKYATQRQRQLA